MEDPYVVSLYSREIVIGAVNNTKVIIYAADHSTLAETVRRGVVNCDEARQFWISWKTGILRIGRGMLDGEELLSYVDTMVRPILAVSVASGSSGEWQFTRDAGE
jgi:Farnesoic acid 0-methyl transferase